MSRTFWVLVAALIAMILVAYVLHELDRMISQIEI